MPRGRICHPPEDWRVSNRRTFFLRHWGSSRSESNQIFLEGFCNRFFIYVLRFAVRCLEPSQQLLSSFARITSTAADSYVLCFFKFPSLLKCSIVPPDGRTSHGEIVSLRYRNIRKSCLWLELLSHLPQEYRRYWTYKFFTPDYLVFLLDGTFSQFFDSTLRSISPSAS